MPRSIRESLESQPLSGLVLSVLPFDAGLAPPRAACFLLTRRDELAGTAKRAITMSERESHDQNLGAQHLGQRAEGDVGGGRARAAARAHRRRRRLRQEQGASLS